MVAITLSRSEKPGRNPCAPVDWSEPIYGTGGRPEYDADSKFGANVCQ